jgi:hypothetical protein
MFGSIQYLKAHAELFYIEKNEEEIIKWDQEIYTSSLEEGMTSAYTGMIIKGGEESKVGVKSFEDLEDIFESIRNSRE